MDQEIKSLIDKFDSARQNYDEDINTLNHVIQLGEHLIFVAQQSSIHDVAMYAAHYLIVPYDERARYYRHFGYYDRAEHPKNIEQSIRDYSQVIALIPIARGKEPDGYEGKFRLAYEGRCECYLELDAIEPAMSDANFIIETFADSQAYLLRSKCYFRAKMVQDANADCTRAMELSKSQWDSAEAAALQDKIKEALKTG